MNRLRPNALGGLSYYGLLTSEDTFMGLHLFRSGKTLETSAGRGLSRLRAKSFG